MFFLRKSANFVFRKIAKIDEVIDHNIDPQKKSAIPFYCDGFHTYVHVLRLMSSDGSICLVANAHVQKPIVTFKKQSAHFLKLFFIIFYYFQLCSVLSKIKNL
jgi:hypothetical protein